MECRSWILLPQFDSWPRGNFVMLQFLTDLLIFTLAAMQLYKQQKGGGSQ